MAKFIVVSIDRRERHTVTEEIGDEVDKVTAYFPVFHLVQVSGEQTVI